MSETEKTVRIQIKVPAWIDEQFRQVCKITHKGDLEKAFVKVMLEKIGSVNLPTLQPSEQQVQPSTV